MDVALLFYGQPRFLDNLESSNTHLKHILYPYQTDVFVHTWWDRGTLDYDPSSWSGLKSLPADPYTIQKINTMYHPVHAVYERPRMFDDNRELNNIKSQLYSIMRIGEIIEDYEYEYGKYDFIILSRFDNIIHQFPNLNTLEKGFYKMHDHPGFADQMFIFSPEYLEFCDAFQWYDESYSGSIEEFKQDYFHFKFREHPIKTAPFYITLARS